jgi:hypothetical protein
VGGKVAGIKTTPGVRRDASRGSPGETQVAGRKSRNVRRGASRGTQIVAQVAGRKARAGRGT